MSHLDEGVLLVLRDGGPVDADARLHSEACAVCRSALAEAGDRARDLTRMLASLDLDHAVDMETAKAEVRRRLDERRESAYRRGPRVAWALGRAAILLLAAAGVAYAIPGSPLRSWIESATAPEAVDPAPALDSPAATGGVEVTVPATGLRIVLTSAGAEQLVEVRWVEGDRASIVAAPGSRYSVAEGRAGVVLQPGPVAVELPETASPVTIDVDGRTILRRVDGVLELPGVVVSRTDERIVLSTGGR